MKVDFAQNAESYGCKAWRMSDESSLLDALEASRLHYGPILLDTKVLPKTMTHDYEACWRTGDAPASRSGYVTQAAEQTLARLSINRLSIPPVYIAEFSFHLSLHGSLSYDVCTLTHSSLFWNCFNLLNVVILASKK